MSTPFITPHREFTHHLDVFVNATEVLYEVHARLLIALHLVIARNGFPLAAAWPDWKDRPGEFGFLFRAVGAPEELTQFQHAIRGLLERDLIRLYPMLPIPENITKTVSFVKVKTTGGVSSTVRRLERRAEARGTLASFDRAGATARFEAKKPQANHCLTLHSVTSDQRYLLHLVRRPGPSQSRTGRNFGLGYTLPDF